MIPYGLLKFARKAREHKTNYPNWRKYMLWLKLFAPVDYHKYLNLLEGGGEQ